MSTKTLKPLVFLIIIITAVSLACQTLSRSSEPEPAPPAPVQVPQQPAPQPDESPQQDPPAPSNDYVVFVDRNDLYQIEVPANWEQSEATRDNHYVDQFTSPDGNAEIENLVYDDGEPFTGNSKGKFALELLHKYLSNTGEEGDIRISDDKIMPDDSERLTWHSRGGDYSGMSFFEVRNNTTFLMFTVYWNDDSESDYADILNHAIETYVVP